MRVYVASKFENVDEVHEAQEKLQAQGHIITHDWTHERPGDRTGLELEEYLTDCAIKDMYGVKSADVVLVINCLGGKGMFVEMGMGIAWEKPIFVVFPDRLNNIFTHLTGVETHPTIDSAVDAITEFAETFE